MADKPDSHDICFIADGDTRGFLRRALGDRPGALVDAETGAEVGRHDGAYGFTVGQRRGLGLDRPGGGRRGTCSRSSRWPARSRSGPGSLLDVGAVTGSRPVWTAGSPPAESFGCLAQLRAHARAGAGGGDVGAGEVEVRAGQPVRGVATGQAVVLYDGDAVLGSATIAATRRVEPAGAGTIAPMSRTSLVVIDMINPYDHADADKLVGSVREVLPQVGGLLERAGDSTCR